jgi:hypothetical protein
MEHPVPAVQAAAEQGQTTPALAGLMPQQHLLQIAAVEVAVVLLLMAVVAQEPPVSSSLNTTHHYNPFLHSKAQPSG